MRRFTLAPLYQLHCAALLFYLGLAFMTLYPLLFQAQTHAPGYDYFHYHWNFWWVKQALTEGLPLYSSNYVMFPAENNLAYQTLTLFWFPLWALLEPLLGTVLALNLIIMLVSVLNGYSLFALLRRWGTGAGVALLAGAALQLFPIMRYWYYNSHLNLMDWFWVPAHLLLWEQVARSLEAERPRRALGWALVQGLALWALLLTDLQLPLYVGFALGLYALGTLYQARQRLRLCLLGLLALGLAFLGGWFAGPLPYLDDLQGNFVPGPAAERPGIDFPTDFLHMSSEWWQWYSPSTGAFVTLALILAIGLALWKRVAVGWGWLLLALPPLLVAVGPALPFYRWLYDLSDGMLWMPWRVAPLFVIGGALFAGRIFSAGLPAAPRRRVWWLAGALFLLLLDLRVFETAPLQVLLPDYDFYAEIGRENNRHVVLEVPTGAGTGEVLLGDPEAISFQYYGIVHEKPMINGFLARAPIEHFWYLHTEDPMLAWLGQRRPLEAAQVEAQLRERIFAYPIGYIVVHQDFVQANGATPLEISAFFNGLPDLLCPWRVEGAALVYRTAAHPQDCPPNSPAETAPGRYEIDIGAAEDVRFLGEGWHYAEAFAGVTLRWAGAADQATLHLELPPGAYTLQLAMQAFQQMRQVRLSVNGVPLPDEAQVTNEALGVYAFHLPADLVGEGQHLELKLHYDARLIPAEVGQGSDQRPLAVLVDWLRFVRQEE